MVRKYVAGKMWPMKEPTPSSDDTGLSRPAYCTLGIKVPMIVTNMAAIWLWVKVDANRPKPVEHATNTSAVRVSVAKLPVSGTPNTVTANAVSKKKFTMASAM